MESNGNYRLFAADISFDALHNRAIYQVRIPHKMMFWYWSNTECCY